MILKKSFHKKTASCIAYQRHAQCGGFLRVDQTNWRRALQELIKATAFASSRLERRTVSYQNGLERFAPNVKQGFLVLSKNWSRFFQRCGKKKVWL